MNYTPPEPAHTALKNFALAWRDYKLNNISNTAEHIGTLFIHKRNFEKAATPDAVLELIAEIDQLRAEVERVRRETVEDCAEAIDDACREQIMTASDCIELIRELLK